MSVDFSLPVNAFKWVRKNNDIGSNRSINRTDVEKCTISYLKLNFTFSILLHLPYVRLSFQLFEFSKPHFVVTIIIFHFMCRLSFVCAVIKYSKYALRQSHLCVQKRQRHTCSFHAVKNHQQNRGDVNSQWLVNKRFFPHFISISTISLAANSLQFILTLVMHTQIIAFKAFSNVSNVLGLVQLIKFMIFAKKKREEKKNQNSQWLRHCRVPWLYCCCAIVHAPISKWFSPEIHLKWVNLVVALRLVTGFFYFVCFIAVFFIASVV